MLWVWGQSWCRVRTSKEVCKTILGQDTALCRSHHVPDSSGVRPVTGHPSTCQQRGHWLVKEKVVLGTQARPKADTDTWETKQNSRLSRRHCHAVQNIFFFLWRQWEHKQFTQPGSFACKLKSLHPGDFLKSCRCSLTCFSTNIFTKCREGWEMGSKSTWAHQRMLWRTWLQRSQHSDTSQHRRVLKDWKK